MTVEEIRKAFGSRLIGSPFVRQSVCVAVSFLPQDIQRRVTSSVWIVSSPEDAWAITFRGDELQNRHLIFLSDELFREPKDQINYTILHEIGHVVLNHRNAIGYEQTASEIRRQEREADTFAKRYLLTKV